MKKHPQFILAIDNHFFINRNMLRPFNHMDYEQFLNEAASHLVIRERDALEKNPHYRQVLPYVVVRQTDAEGVTRLSAYRRTSGAGESRLAGNVSIGYGGHIDLNDIYVDEKSNVGLSETIAQAMMRELVEEITLEVDGVQMTEQEAAEFFSKQTGQMSGKNFILDNSNEVGTVHVGLVFYVDIDPSVKISCREDELTDMPMMTAQELLASDLPKENWTQIILEELTAPPIV